MTKITIGDIDIDTADRTRILSLISYIPAKKSDGSKHPTGVYVSDIPFDPITGLAEDAYDINLTPKIDFLNLTFLEKFSSNEEIVDLMNIEPNWDMLKDINIVRELPQIHDHYELVLQMKPRSINDLVELLSKIREHSGYQFKKSHSTAYALNIVVLLNYYRKYGIKLNERDSILSSDLFSNL